MNQHDAHVFDYVINWIETERKLELLAESLGMGKEFIVRIEPIEGPTFTGPFGCDPQDGMVGAWDE